MSVLIQDVRWRVIRKALQNLMHGEVTYMTATLQALVEFMPDQNTMHVAGLEYERVMQFLDEECDVYEDLLGRDHYIKGTTKNATTPKIENKPDFVWYSVRWSEHELEALFYPRSHGSNLYLLGGDIEVLHRFGAALRTYCTLPTGTIMVFTNGGFFSSPEMDREIRGVSWDDVYLPEEDIRQIQESTRAFFDNEDLYKSLGVAWKRGVLLVGPPGTGKTMVCKAVLHAQEDIPAVYLRDLATFGGSFSSAIRDVFRRAREIAPCFLILEDIDGLINTNDGAVRTTFLNELDGITPNHGILTLATSNHPAHIDEALLKRPSRFDRVFWVELPDHDERLAYTRMFAERAELERAMGDYEDYEELLYMVAEKTNGFTLAYVKEAFLGSLLEYANRGERPDENFGHVIEKNIQVLKKAIRETKQLEKSMLGTGSGGMGFSSPAVPAAPQITPYRG